MATTLRSVLALVLLLSMKLAASNKDEFTYNGFRGVNLTLNGIAVIEPNGLLQLTNNSKQKLGHAFYPVPLQFENTSNGNSLSFTTTFVFSIFSEYPDLSGHGIAFTISPSPDLSGALPSQYLGLLNFSNNGNPSNHVFAVELDTVNSLEFGDINNNHVGIDMNSLRSNQSAPAAYYCNGEIKNISLISGEAIQVWVDYDGVEKQLNVTLAPFKIPKPDRPLLSSNLDLSPIFLDSMFMGFSSSTGSVGTSHYVLGWSFKMNGQAQPLGMSRLPSLPRRGPRKRFTKGFEIGIPLATAVFVLTTTLGTIYLIRKKKYAEIYEDWENEYGPHRFSYKDLYVATNGFRDKELLGIGGFGRVYKGVVRSSKIEIAVKRVSHDSKQGLREFVAELVSLGRLRLRNLVKLLGYCRLKGELLLVYDLMPNGSLDKFIFDQQKSILNWAQRFKIIRGAAAGLLYLHEEWEQIVVHRDVKASNILLDADFNGRLGDFGLARLYDHGTNPRTTHIVGTLGYLAPELTRTGKATTSSDVFAFGALLLEVACGRRPIELQASPEELVLVDWVVDCWKRGAILEAGDPALEGDFAAEEMDLVLKLGLLCSHPVSATRPSMRQVMHFLDRDVSLPESLLDGASSGLFSGAGGEVFADFAISYPSSLEKMSMNSLSGSESLQVSIECPVRATL